MAARADGRPRSAPVPICDLPPIAAASEDRARELAAKLGSEALLARIRAYAKAHHQEARS